MTADPTRTTPAANLTDRLRVLATAAREFSEATQDPERLLDMVARRVAEGVKDQCVVRIVSDDGTLLVPVALHGADEEAARLLRDAHSDPVPLDAHPITRRVHETGEPFVAARFDPESARSSTTPRFYEWARSVGVHSVLMLALRSRGRSLGQLLLMRYRPESPAFDENDVTLACALADHAAIAIANSRAYAAERAARQAADSAAAELQRAQARFARLSESGLIGVMIHDLGGAHRVVEVNDAVLDMLGFTREEILSGAIAWPDVTPAEWRGDHAHVLDRLRSTRMHGLREKEYLHKDGRRVPVMTGAAMLDGGEDLCISFVLDLTEQRKAQAAIEQMREERAADAKFRALAAIVDSSDDAIIGKTLEGVITSWNGGARRLFGYEAGEVLGRSISILIPADLAHEEPVILATIAKGDVMRFDTERMRKDGRRVAVSVTSSPVHDAAGQIVGISKVARDITDRRRAELALARAKDVAEAANRELEAFSYSVAHDLRAPLRGMNGFAQLLLDSHGGQLDAEGKDWLSEVVLNARKMGELIDGLLTLARTSRSELRHEDVDLSGVAREIVGRLTATNGPRDVDVVIQDHLTVHADPRLASALLENLLGNAWKFTSKAHGARVEFGATRHDGAHTFFVRDNGAGFDMAFAGKLFAPFHRLHTTEEFPGTGVGLATVQRIVHRHGGRIWAEGGVDAGATFYFTLPGVGSG